MTDLGTQLPETGGRVRLVRARVTPERAEYDVVLMHPGGSVQGRMGVEVASGAVSAAPEGAPAWLGTLAVALLRGAHRRHAEAGWPRRITRWRAERER